MSLLKLATQTLAWLYCQLCVIINYTSIQNRMLTRNGSETWPVRKENEMALQRVEMRIVRWISGVVVPQTHRNAVPVNIFGPERRSGSYPSSQVERYCCSVPANVCRQDRICLF